MTHNLDSVDEQIISMLEADGRRSSAEIGRALDIPSSTVRRRIDRLVNEEVITIRAFAHSQKIGLPVHVFLEFQVILEQVTSTTKALASFKELRWVGVMSGGTNILSEGFFSSSQHLHAFFTERLATLPGIQHVETHHVLRLEKFAFDWSAMLHAAKDYEFDDGRHDDEKLGASLERHRRSQLERENGDDE